ncbi:MAG: AMP-binding protein [Myxococcales bacterium]|nr:AMP-binding protein [Myxococcales bacterium]MCB9627553.1 AMP-binding protein [Sandaracinaceae bacterium]
MKVALTLRPLHGTLERPLTNAVASFDERRGWLVVARLAGVYGLGEASPLVGYSSDGPDETEAALRALGGSVVVATDTLEDFVASVARAADQLPSTAHAARFGLESALFDAYARARGVPLWAVLRHGLELGARGAQAPTSLGVAAWVPEGDLAAAEAASAAGVHTFKLKLGRDLPAELAFARRLRARFPAARLRFDANRSLAGARTGSVLVALAALGADFCEEPSAELPASSPLPLALDESLCGLAPEDVPDHPNVCAWVLKPTALGGLLRCAGFVREALARGIEPLVSHTLEGPVADAILRELALAIGGGSPVGLGDHGGLRALAPPFTFEAHAGRAGAAAQPHQRPGAGVFEVDLSVREAARAHPQRVAIEAPEGPLTYAALAERCEAQQRAFEQAGLRSGDALAFVPQLDTDTVVLVYSAIEAGLALVPLHPRGTPDEHELVVRESGARWLHQRSSRPPLGEHEAAKHPLPETPLAILFTSGTTGSPKGALLSRRAFVAAVWASEERLGAAPDERGLGGFSTERSPERWLLSLTPAHVGGLSILVRALVQRGTLVLPPSAEFEPATFARVVREQRVSQLSVVPTMLARLLDAGFVAPPTLRVMLVGGAAADADLVARAHAAGLPVRLTYGMTETCSQIATQRTPADPGCGPPLAGVQVRAREGVLEVRGATLFSGYLGQREPVDEHGWFRTGDLGRVDAQGCVHIEGRRHDLIVTGGENVYPAEVEARLADHPHVREAAVIGVRDATWGQRVVAVCVLQDPGDRCDGDGALGTLAEVAAALATSLARFKQPKEYWLVPALPRTSLGKVARAGLQGLLDAPDTRVIDASALRL